MSELLRELINLKRPLSEAAHINSMKLSRATVGTMNVVVEPGEQEQVMMIRIDSEITEELVLILGVPADGTSYKIRTGYMVYDKPHKTLFFSRKKFSLPKIKD